MAYLHLLAMAVWVGGILFIAAVMVPVTRRLEAAGRDQGSPGAGSQALGMTARRFRPIGWAALVTLVVTGAWLLAERGVGLGDILSGEGPFYGALRLKLGLVVLLLTLGAFHDFVLGPWLARKLTQAGAQGASEVKGRRAISWLARVNLLVTFAVVAMGAVLVRGSPV
ncbi:MAG: CopD family protein [Dehalococcoidia bacterium]